MFSSYKNETVMTMDCNIYLVQYGSYINKEVMMDNLDKLEDYITYEEDNKYYIFLGAYTDILNANRLKQILEEENIYTYIKNDYIGNSEVINKIKDLEKIINEENILDINKKIIEILKNIEVL